MAVGLYLEFTYGTQGGLPLTKEIILLACRHGRYFPGLKMYDMNQGYENLFKDLKWNKALTFIKANQVLDFSSHFSSAYADQRVLEYAKLIARENGQDLDMLVFKNYQVTKYDRVGAVDDCPEPFQLITIQAKEVLG